MKPYDCTRSIWASNDDLAKFQFVCDLLIGLAYIIVPLEIWYIAKKLSHPWCSKIFMLFEAFIFLCGTTHFINLWVLSCDTETVNIVQTVAKVLCAIASCATAVTLVSIIHGLLTEKLLYLKSKASELDPEKSLVKIQQGICKTEY